MRALMKTKVSLGQSGIMVHHKDTVIALDPSRHADSHFTFVSHAHIDHLHKRGMAKKKNKSQVLASKETALIAEATCSFRMTAPIGIPSPSGLAQAIMSGSMRVSEGSTH